MRPRKITTYRKNFNWNYSNTCQPNRTTTTTTNTTWPCNSPKFRTVRTECQWRMGSYRNVYSQFTAACRYAYMSPTTANRWIRYVNNGAQVYKFTNRDFCNYWGNKFANPRMAYQYLRNHYGNIIKDVTRGKGNCWLIATTRTPTGRPFMNYDW